MVKSASDELEEFLNRATPQFNARMMRLAEAIIRNSSDVGPATEWLARLIGQTMTLADLYGRRRCLLEFDHLKRQNRFKTGGNANLPTLYVTAGFSASPGFTVSASNPINPAFSSFREAIDDVVSREPRLARNADEVSLLYRTKHAFALAKSASEVLTKRIQDEIVSMMEKGLGVDKASEILSNISGFAESYSSTVYRTNTATAYSAGRFQEVSSPEVREVVPAFEYDAILDSDVRPNHAAAHGLLADVKDSLWDTYAAPMGHNCFVPGTLVSGSFVGGSKALYSGPVVEIETNNGRRLSVTVNHPILTAKGWRPANALTEGDNLFCYGMAVEFLDTRNNFVSLPFSTGGAIHNQDVPARIEDVFNSIHSHGTASSIADGSGLTPLDFHGDAVFMDGDVNVVSVNGEFGSDPDSSLYEGVANFDLMESESSATTRNRNGFNSSLFHRNESSRRSLPCGSTLLLDGGPVHLRPLEPLRIGPASNVDAQSSEEARNRGTADPDFVRQLLHARSAKVSLDKIIRITRREFRGHVYDLQSVQGWIVSQGIYTSNCRCSLRLVDKWELQSRGLLENGVVRRVIPATFGSAFPDKGFGGGNPSRRIYGF